MAFSKVYPSLLTLASVLYASGKDSISGAPSLAISNATFTSKWIEGTDHVQIVELILANTDSSTWVTAADNLAVAIKSPSVDTITPGVLTRLRAGDKAIVQVGVQNKAGIAPGTACSATISVTLNGTEATSTTLSNQNCGVGNFTADTTSLAFHSSPDWFNDIKYGIFIHWGVYSAPAYGSVGANENYAEWYWNRMHNPSDKTQTYQYHKETYGIDFNYDHFISNFTASRFDAQEWVQLIADAGAQYLVPVTKHHDGFALFNFSTSISKRSSVNFGPKRDFIGEILDAAKQFQPQLRRGTYFSLPEWYNPLYTSYAQSSFPGGPPVNPYTNEVIPYTGHVPVSDFILDIQAPQMNVLAYSYETEIMWCDIGGANNSTIVMSAWLNWASSQNRQVVFNNRCGIRGDFDTPEYTTNVNSVARKWESSRGMDPFSYGYNYQTPDASYLSSEEIVQSLVDIVSKNGNFLLDIGPRNDGTIAEIMQTNLRGAGVWIKDHAESLFGTRYWLTTPGLGNLRYTTTPSAFYIHSLVAPSGNVVIPDPVPFLEGDKVTVLGGSLNGTTVSFSDNGDGSYTLGGSPAIAAADQFVWTFRITYSS